MQTIIDAPVVKTSAHADMLMSGWKDYVVEQTVEALGYLDNHPEMALPARVQHMRDLYDDMYIDLANKVEVPHLRAPMMAYVESIDRTLVTL